jgi:hypothetical protein
LTSSFEESYIDYAAYLKYWKAEKDALKTATLVIEDGPGPDLRTCAGLLRLHARLWVSVLKKRLNKVRLSVERTAKYIHLNKVRLKVQRK